MRFHARPTLPVRVQVLKCGPKLVADPEHLDLLQQGVDTWNAWRAEKPSIRPDLSGAYLSKTNLVEAHLRSTILHGANLIQADLFQADLREADLSGADLSVANLLRADLSGANVSGANLSGAVLVETNLSNAVISGCGIYGVSAWKVRLNEDTNSKT